MKRLLLVLFVLTLVGGAYAEGTIPVTFQVNLKVKTGEGLFIPGTDNVTIRGSFMDEIGLSGDWFPDEGGVIMADDDADTIYTTTIDMDESYDGTTFEFKYTINETMWEEGDNRRFTVTKPETILPVAWFDHDSVVTLQVINTLNFTADLSDIYGAGEGYFDPDQHELELMGLDWVGAVVVEEGSDRTFVEDPFMPGIFHATMVIQGVEGDSTKWKTKGSPDSCFFNWGWEVTPDRWHTIIEDGSVIDVPAFKPTIFPAQPPLTEDVDILFQVNMTDAHNYYTKEGINPNELSFVGIKGQNEALGSWAGDWLPSDTLAENQSLLVMNDSGINGDKVAGDHIWSLLVTFPKENVGGPSLYKYGACYPGAVDVNEGFHPLDNEMQGTDHWVNIKVGGTSELYDDFGLLTPSSTTDVRALSNTPKPQAFDLAQNYPNPFNPVTVISYTLPNNGLVELTVYNMLGQEVAILVNKEQNAGIHKIEFNAMDIPSGVYFYNLNYNNKTITRKMILMK